MNEQNNFGNENGEQSSPKSESTLFSAPPPETKNLSARQRQSALKKQLRTVLFLGVGVIAAVCLYFVVVLPIVNYIEEVYKEPIELLDGEILGLNDRIMMYEHLERSEIQEIEVHNEHGEFGFYYDEKDESFYVKGYPAAPYDKEKISKLFVSAGYTLSIERVTTKCENWEEYGLAESDNPAWYTITSREGNKHTVYIGDIIPTGAGYYVRYKDRDAVYILDESLGTTMLEPLENMITPTLALPMTQNDYFMIENFALMRNEEPVVGITYLDQTQMEDSASTSPYKMLYPGGYTVNSGNYSIALNVLMNFQGMSTLVYDPTDEELMEYGLDTPEYALYYKYKDIEQTLMFAKNEEGKIYAYSLLFDLISEINADDMKWLDWDLISWVDTPLFQMNINDVKTIKIESDTATRTFDLVGTGSDLVVTERATGFKPDVTNFRQLYKTMLSLDFEDYVGLTEEEIEALDDSEDLYMTMTIETRAGQTTVYKFYPYTTRRAYYTVNGEGEFCIIRDKATKVITDAEKVMINEIVDSDANH